MWVSYSHSQTLADMATAKSLGFNTLRVILASDNHAFNFYTPTAGQLANLVDFYNCAKTANIKLHFTFFDGWGNYGQISHCQTWLQAIIGALPDFTMVQVFELQNETQFASTATYSGNFDSGWPSGVTQYGTVGPVTLQWAQLMIPYIRSLAPGVPVTISTRGEAASSGTGGGIEDLAALYAVVAGTSAAPDWYEWHCYVYNSFPGGVYAMLQRAIATVGGDPNNLFIGEFGAASTATGALSAVQAQQAQVDYTQAVRWACAQLGLPEPAPWILFDLAVSTYWTSTQFLGLFDTTGAIKLAGQHYQALPPGTTRLPSSTFNGNMQGSWSDANGNTMPYRWYTYKGNTAAQPITVSIDNANRYLGNASTLMTGSSGMSSSDNPPGIETRPITWPLIQQGQSYTFSIALKGTGSTGTPTISISWYSASAYISAASLTGITLTGSFTRYTVTGAAPAGAAYARLFVFTPYNGGSIWAAGALWTGQSARLVAGNGRWLRR